MNVYLSGFMGAGKSTVAGPLAGALDLPCLDLDQEIETRHHATIARIFENQGEAAFRRYEFQVLRALQGPAVISLGGGAPMNPHMGDFLQKTGKTIFLQWPIEVLIDRIAGDPNRPLSMDVNGLAQKYLMRLPVYRQADLIWVSRPPHRETPEDIVAWILARLSPS